MWNKNYDSAVLILFIVHPMFIRSAMLNLWSTQVLKIGNDCGLKEVESYLKDDTQHVYHIEQRKLGHYPNNLPKKKALCSLKKHDIIN